MKRFALAAAVLAMAAVPALANEATFERNLTVNGHVELQVATGSGHIHITKGSGDRVHISGRVKSNWGGSEQKVQEIANNPPIEQTGNIIPVKQKVGDVVLYGKYAGTEVSLDGEDLLMMRSSDILMKVG